MNYLISGECDQLPLHKLFTDNQGQQYLVLRDELIIKQVTINDGCFSGVCQCGNKDFFELSMNAYCDSIHYTEMVEPKPFSLGNVFITPNALDVFNKIQEEALSFLARHAACDWGHVCVDDAALNNSATVDGSRILSSYRYQNKEVLIITEADRTYTTLLLPSEY
ncbi:hypothetical protein [Photobacterium frigidiphilum]|nr:hypothetical protein [Photobacterium frigidiphilum]